MQRQIWIVARKSYRENVKGAGFWLMILSPFIMFGVSFAIGYFLLAGQNINGKLAVVGDDKIVRQLQSSESFSAEVKGVESLDKAKEELQAKKIDAYLEVKDEHYHLVGDKIKSSEIKEGLNPLKLTIDEEKLGKSELGGVLINGISFLTFLFLLIYVSLIASEIADEKSGHIMEILLSASSPKAQYYGKILGILLVAGTQIGAYLLAFLAILPFVARNLIFSELLGLFSGIDLHFIIYLSLMSLIATLAHLFIAAAIAALVSEQSQLQQAISPVLDLAIVGMLVGIIGGNLPKHLTLDILSYIPFFSTSLMPARLISGTASVFEAWAALFIMLLTCLLLARIGEKFYEKNVVAYRDEKIWKQIFHYFRKSF